MLAKAWEDLQSHFGEFVKDISEEESDFKKNSSSVTIEFVRTRMNKIDKFMNSLEQQFKRHQDYFQPKVWSLMDRFLILKYCSVRFTLTKTDTVTVERADKRHNHKQLYAKF